MRLRGFPGCRERWRSAAPANLDQLGELPSKNRSREKACLASGGGGWLVTKSLQNSQSEDLSLPVTPRLKTPFESQSSHR